MNVIHVHARAHSLLANSLLVLANLLLALAHYSLTRYSRSHSRLLAPAKRTRTNALGLQESTRCVRDFCERVRVAHTQLAIICEQARNAD